MTGIKVTGRHPVENVSWPEATQALADIGLALPTEVQWEYAAWARDHRFEERDLEKVVGVRGRPAANVFDRAAKGIFVGESVEFHDGHRLHAPVGSYDPNGFGLLDMVGNVEEWCLCRFGSDELPLRAGTGERLVAPYEGMGQDGRAVRGGSYRDVVARVMPNWRRWEDAVNRSGARGVRACRLVR